MSRLIKRLRYCVQILYPYCVAVVFLKPQMIFLCAFLSRYSRVSRKHQELQNSRNCRSQCESHIKVSTAHSCIITFQPQLRISFIIQALQQFYQALCDAFTVCVFVCVIRLPEGFTQLLSLTQLYLNDAFLEFLPASFGRSVCSLVWIEINKPK